MAISSPLLEASIDGAHGVLLSIQGGSDLGLFEINEAAQLVANSAAVDANIIFGAVIDDALGDEVRVTVIAAGFDEQRAGRPAAAPALTQSSSRPAPPVAAPPAQRAGSASSVSHGTVAAGSGTASGAPASASWAGGTTGTTAGGRDGAAAGGHSSAGQQASQGAAATGSAATSGTSGGWQPSSSFTFTSDADTSAGAGYSAVPEAANGHGQPAGTVPPVSTGGSTGAGSADPAGGIPAQPTSDAPSGYVPASVSFMSDDDEEYPAKSGHDGARSDATPGWKDSGRAAKQDKVFDVTAGRRRPVVFEEDDDLDVPDFLK
jgi:cell division protein FtsZ